MGLFESKQERLNRKLREASTYKGSLEKAELFLAKGADVNGKDSYGRTPLMEACRYSSTDVAEMLIKQGCNINAIDVSGWTALHCAANGGADNIVRMLIQRGCDLNMKTKGQGWTALHFAVYKGSFSIVRLLTESGADPNILDNEANKPKDLAMFYRHPGIAAFLAKKSESVQPPVMPTTTGWILTAPEEVAFTAEKNGVGYGVTEIFNFNARMYTQIARNLKTNAESLTVRFFDEFPDDRKILEEALQKLQALGGTADSAVIHGRTLDKKPSAKF